MHRLVIAAAAALSLVPGLAAAAAPPCLTPAEFGAVTRFALPSVVAGIGQRCASALPADAYLRRQNGAPAARYAIGADAAWPATRAALERLTGSDRTAGPMLHRMDDASLQGFVRGTVSGFVAARLPIDRCPAVDKLLSLLAPLPPADTADLVATAVGLAAARKAKLGPIAVCPA